MKRQVPTSEKQLISRIDPSLDQLRNKGYFQHKIDQVNEILATSGSARDVDTQTQPKHVTAADKRTARWKKLHKAFINLEQNHDLAIHTNMEAVIGYIYRELSPQKAQSSKKREE